MNRIPESEWVWFGRAAHFISSRWCRFRLATAVGPWIISSVGDMVHPATGEISEIGWNRTHETMVFRRGVCECGCGEPAVADFNEIEMVSANSDAECTRNHMAMCRKYAEIEADSVVKENSL